MERIKHIFGHWHLVIMTASMVAGVLSLFSAPLWVWLFIPLGIGLQYLNEYGLHRYIFHLPPPDSQWAFDLLYQAHYGHHDFPTNRALFFAPWWVALPMLAFNYGLIYVIASVLLPEPFFVANALVLVGGIGTFIGYEWFHMTAHITVPKNALERHVTTLHNQHHFRDFSRWFHVSPGGQVIDKAMGTAIDRDALKSQQRIEFIRTLGMSPDDPRLISARSRFAGKYGLTDQEIERAAFVKA